MITADESGRGSRKPVAKSDSGVLDFDGTAVVLAICLTDSTF